MDQRKKKPTTPEEAFFESLVRVLASTLSPGTCSNPKRLIAITEKAFAVESFTVTDPHDIVLHLHNTDRDYLFKRLQKTYPEEMALHKKGELDSCGKGLNFMNAIGLTLNTYVAQELSKVLIDKDLGFRPPFTITCGKDDFFAALKALPVAEGPTGALALTFAKHAMKPTDNTPADIDALVGLAGQIVLTIDLEAPWKTKEAFERLVETACEKRTALHVQRIQEALDIMEENIKERSAQICFKDDKGGWCNCLIPTLFTNSRILIEGERPKTMFLNGLGAAQCMLQETKQEKLN